MRTVVYVRVSTLRQAQAQTIEQQFDRLGTHLHAGGEELASETIFRDDGYSGATLNRLSVPVEYWSIRIPDTAGEMRRRVSDEAARLGLKMV